MRTFSCFVTDSSSTVPTLTIVLAANEVRVRLLAHRELIDRKSAVSIDVFEGGRLRWTEWV